MKASSSANKAGRKAVKGFSEATRDGENAVAVAPRKYGIDFVDQQMASSPPSEQAGAVMQPKRNEASHDAVEAPLPSAENPTGMPKSLRKRLEGLSQMDLSDVRVHTNSAEPAQIGARAYAFGNDIHLAPGHERHLAHEAWHVVQQRQGRVKPTTNFRGAPINDHPGLEREADVMGERARGRDLLGGGGAGMTSIAQAFRPPAAKHAPQGRASVVQGYFEEKYPSGTWLQADDMSVATESGYPNHKLYAKAGKAATANVKLAAVNSGIELIETGTTEKFWDISIFPRQAMLKKIEAKNKENNTSGDDMLLYADCGKSEAVISGGSNRQAIYDKPGGMPASKVEGSPREMKVAIMKAYLDYKKAGSAEVRSAIADAKLEEVALDLIDVEFSMATTDPEKKEIKDRYKAKLDEIAEAYWKYYNTLSDTERNRIDLILRINRYAKPDVGQGYTISSGGASAGKSTWNFHWGGVVMTSDDGHDKVVLENYAVGDPAAENKKWTFDIYGTRKTGQTFHERHAATQQHGVSPTTMTIEKKP